MTPVEFHSPFGFGNRSIRVFDRAMTPSPFVMLRCLKLGAGSPQMLKRPAHMRLIGTDRNIERANCS